MLHFVPAAVIEGGCVTRIYLTLLDVNSIALLTLSLITHTHTQLRIEFPKDYPSSPPSAYFIKNYIPQHEHVYTNGDICLSLLGKDWRPTMTAESIAISILSILGSAREKLLPPDNSMHSGKKAGQAQDNFIYHDDNC